MIRAPGRPSRPSWTERSSFRKKIPAHRPVLPPPTAGFRVGADRPWPGNIAVFQGVASLAPFAVPAGARSRFGRRSGVVLRGKRNFIIEIPIPATPAPDRDSSARPEWRPAGTARGERRAAFPFRCGRPGRPAAVGRRRGGVPMCHEMSCSCRLFQYLPFFRRGGRRASGAPGGVGAAKAAHRRPDFRNGAVHAAVHSTAGHTPIASASLRHFPR